MFVGICFDENMPSFNHEYEIQTFQRLRDFQSKGILCDLTLTSKDNIDFRVHASVIASASNSFCNLFLETGSKKKMRLMNVTGSSLALLIRFIYGENFESFEELKILSQTLNGLGMKELFQYIGTSLCHSDGHSKSSEIPQKNVLIDKVNKVSTDSNSKTLVKKKDDQNQRSSMGSYEGLFKEQEIDSFDMSKLISPSDIKKEPQSDVFPSDIAAMRCAERPNETKQVQNSFSTLESSENSQTRSDDSLKPVGLFINESHVNNGPNDGFTSNGSFPQNYGTFMGTANQDANQDADLNHDHSARVGTAHVKSTETSPAQNKLIESRMNENLVKRIPLMLKQVNNSSYALVHASDFLKQSSLPTENLQVAHMSSNNLSPSTGASREVVKFTMPFTNTIPTDTTVPRVFIPTQSNKTTSDLFTQVQESAKVGLLHQKLPLASLQNRTIAPRVNLDGNLTRTYHHKPSQDCASKRIQDILPKGQLPIPNNDIIDQKDKGKQQTEHEHEEHFEVEDETVQNIKTRKQRGRPKRKCDFHVSGNCPMKKTKEPTNSDMDDIDNSQDSEYLVIDLDLAEAKQNLAGTPKQSTDLDNRDTVWDNSNITLEEVDNGQDKQKKKTVSLVWPKPLNFFHDLKECSVNRPNRKSVKEKPFKKSTTSAVCRTTRSTSVSTAPATANKTSISQGSAIVPLVNIANEECERNSYKIKSKGNSDTEGGSHKPSETQLTVSPHRFVMVSAPSNSQMYVMSPNQTSQTKTTTLMPMNAPVNATFQNQTVYPCSKTVLSPVSTNSQKLVTLPNTFVPLNSQLPAVAKAPNPSTIKNDNLVPVKLENGSTGGMVLQTAQAPFSGNLIVQSPQHLNQTNQIQILPQQVGFVQQKNVVQKLMVQNVGMPFQSSGPFIQNVAHQFQNTPQSIQSVTGQFQNTIQPIQNLATQFQNTPQSIQNLSTQLRNISQSIPSVATQFANSVQSAQNVMNPFQSTGQAMASNTQTLAQWSGQPIFIQQSKNINPGIPQFIPLSLPLQIPQKSTVTKGNTSTSSASACSVGILPKPVTIVAPVIQAQSNSVLK